MNGERAGQDIAKLFSFVGIIRIGGAAGLQSQKDGFHYVFLGVWDDPFYVVAAVGIGFFKVILSAEDDLFFRRFIKKFADGGAKTLQDIH